MPKVKPESEGRIVVVVGKLSLIVRWKFPDKPVWLRKLNYFSLKVNTNRRSGESKFAGVAF